MLKSLTCALCELHIKFEITDPLIIDEKSADLKCLPDAIMRSGFSETGLNYSKTILRFHEDKIQQFQGGLMIENNI